MHSLVIFTVLATSAMALPKNMARTSTTSTCSSSALTLINFENLGGVPGNAINPIPVPYMGINFQGFIFQNLILTNLAPTVVPHSGTHYITAGVVSTTLGGSAEMTVNYPGSTVKSFTPFSFYYGCMVPLANAVAGVPIACNIAVTGFKSGDDTAEAVPITTQEFSYNPTTNTGVQQMAQGVFNSAFKDVQYLLFQYTLPGGLAGASSDLGMMIDDIKLSTCS